MTLCVAILGLLSTAGGASAQEQLLMSGTYPVTAAEIAIPLINPMNGTGFITVQHGPKNTITVPAGLLKGGGGFVGGVTIPIGGNADLQQFQSSWFVTAPALGDGDGVFQSGLTSLRPQTNFTWCPGMTVENCADPRSSAGGAPPGSGTLAGLIRYQNDGQVYGGTMRMFINGVASISFKVGLTPRFKHTPLVGSGTVHPGGHYAEFVLGATGLPAVVTTGAVLANNTPSGGIIKTLGNFITSTPAELNFTLIGFPLTVGSVYAQGTDASVNTISGVGSKNTLNGRGTITMVTGGLQSEFDQKQALPWFGVFTMSIAESQLTPALSPLAIFALVGVLFTAGGFMLRRSLSAHRA